jgi:K+ transporter
MERPDVALTMELCAPEGLQLDSMEATYFLSREKIVPRGIARGASRTFSTFPPTESLNWERASRFEPPCVRL